MQISTEFSSPNYAPRSKHLEYIILHYTELSFDAALKSYLNPKVELSPHYLIREDGQIFNLVPIEHVAWHAGQSYWRNVEQLNQRSIGIELDNLGNNEFSAIQIHSCVKLCQYLVRSYAIPPQNILGHSDIACERKIDPGIFFDWSYLAKHNLGLWPNLPKHLLKQFEVNDFVMYNYSDQNNEILLLQKKLALLGYKIALTGIFDLQTNFVIRAFTSHFYPKLIKQKGLAYYRDNSAKYGWHNTLEDIINNLLRS